MARPPKNSVALQGAYTKDEVKKRVEQEKRLKGDSDNINPPDFILDDEVALNKFYELREVLKESGVLSNVDTDLLAVYCNCWSMYVNSTKNLLVQDLVDVQENKLGMLTQVANPYIKIQNTYSDKLMKISSLFGLSPADRGKIAHLNPSDKEEESDALIELLKGMKKGGEQ